MGKQKKQLGSDGTNNGSGSSTRGRPKGTVALTKKIEDTILSYIRAGSYDYVAAEAAGISDRTFRDWIARGEGRSMRPSTPRLRTLAKAVRTAKAEARIDAEVRVHREHPTYWLPRAARTKPDREGWTEPAPEPGEAASKETPVWKMSDEELADKLEGFRMHDVQKGAFIAPPCTHARCRCPWHENWRDFKNSRKNSDDEGRRR